MDFLKQSYSNFYFLDKICRTKNRNTMRAL